MKHDNSKTIKLSNTHIKRIMELGDKYNMNDSELVRLGLDLLYKFDKHGKLLKVMQGVLEEG